MPQRKQEEWSTQWGAFQDNEEFLFLDWIYPSVLEDFRDKDVLEGGCGGGQHTRILAALANRITAVDLNTIKIAKKFNDRFRNIDFIDGDIAAIQLDRKFDIVFSIGVIHHTDNPDKTFENLKNHTKPGGKLIIWVYSDEGNLLVKMIVEPLRKIFLKRISHKNLILLSKIITVFLCLPVYTIYLLPLRFLPYYDYFGNFRKLSFLRNTLNVFDKLNAPQVIFITRSKVEQWFNPGEFCNVHISRYKGVSWRGSGIRL